MRIRRELWVKEVNRSDYHGNPDKLVLRPLDSPRDPVDSTITLARGQQLPGVARPWHRLAGQTVICMLKSRTVPLKKKPVQPREWRWYATKNGKERRYAVGRRYEFRVPDTALSPHDLRIEEIRREEQRVKWDRNFGLWWQGRPRWECENRATLVLCSATLGRGNYERLGHTPSPCYELTLPLTPDEYRACWRLVPNTVFRVRFRLKRERKKRRK